MNREKANMRDIKKKFGRISIKLYFKIFPTNDYIYRSIRGKKNGIM